IGHLTMRKHLGDGMAHRLADAQLPLRRPGDGFAMLATRHEASRSIEPRTTTRYFPAQEAQQWFAYKYAKAVRASAVRSPRDSIRSRRLGACPGSFRTPCRIPARRGLRGRRP